MPEISLPKYPFYQRVPKDRRKNLEWRLAVCRRAAVDAEFRDDLRQMCADDPLFFINGFCWVFEPRNVPPKSKVLPMILWDDQERCALTVKAGWGKHDIAVVKSRGRGFTWLIMWLLAHSWLFEDMFTFGLISKDEDSVDKKGDLSTLMPKLDWGIPRLPSWLRPKKVERTAGKLVNLDNGAIGAGYAATGDAASGGRVQVFFMDEQSKFPKTAAYAVMDSTQHVTNCRIMGSTPKGDSGPFYDRCNDGETVKVVMHWSEGPTMNRGLYRVTKDREIVVLDPVNNPLPCSIDELHDMHRRLENRGHRVENTLRSPWYNSACLVTTPLSIAQELDCNFGKSEEKAFERDTIDSLIERTAREPSREGRMKVNDQAEATFQMMKGGNVKLWCPLGGPNLSPPKHAYGAGADVSFGTGGDYSSNSVLIVGDLHTGEQVFEFAASTMRVPEFARLCVAVCKFFWNATLNWDAHGPAGTIFTQEVMERLNYFNILYSTVDYSGPMNARQTQVKKPGWHKHDDSSKATYLSECIEDCLADLTVLRSRLTLNEFGEYGFKNGKIAHMKALRTESEANKPGAHGDRATAASMFNIVRRAMGGQLEPVEDRPPDENGPLQRVPWSCMANRLLDYDERSSATKSRRW